MESDWKTFRLLNPELSAYAKLRDGAGKEVDSMENVKLDEELRPYGTLVDSIFQPALLVQDNAVIYRNGFARELSIDTVEVLLNAILETPLTAGDHLQFEDWFFTIHACGKDCLLVLSNNPNYHWLAAASAQALRPSLADLYAALDALAQKLEEAEDPAVQKLTAEMMRSLYRMMRTVINTQTAADAHLRAQFARGELDALVARICRDAAYAAASCGLSLHYLAPERPIRLLFDPQQIERAVLNLLSNAFRHAAPDSDVAVQVTQNGESAFIDVCNEIDPTNRPTLAATERGTGLTVVRRIASAHCGTLMMVSTGGRFHIRLVLPLEQAVDIPAAASPIVDYCGGFNRMLLELSDVLPASSYDTRSR